LSGSTTDASLHLNSTQRQRYTGNFMLTSRYHRQAPMQYFTQRVRFTGFSVWCLSRIMVSCISQPDAAIPGNPGIRFICHFNTLSTWSNSRCPTIPNANDIPTEAEVPFPADEAASPGNLSCLRAPSPGRCQGSRPSTPPHPPT
jgi:hypothetical protein